MSEETHAITKYLIIVRLYAPTIERLSKVAPAIVKALTAISKPAPELAFRSEKNDTFGYLVKSDKRANVIYQRIVSPGGRFYDTTPAILEGRDLVLVVEIGTDFGTGDGFGRVGTWLQRQ